MKIAISFCNQTKETNNLLILDTRLRNRRYIPIDFQNTGFTGITQTNDYIFALYQSKPNGLIVIDKLTLNIIARVTLSEIIDGHSILLNENKLYVVSTGNDSLIRYNFNRSNLSFEKPKVIWTPKGSSGKNDTHHLNSICLYNRNIYISGFGLKKNKRWSSADEGYISKISDSSKAIKEIFHPHSILVYKNKIYYAESSTRSIMCNNTSIIKLNHGYTRGLCLGKNYLVVGLSSGRRSSKSTGIINNNADPGLLESSCKILFFEKKNFWRKYNCTDEFNFFPEHQEIYDICKIN